MGKLFNTHYHLPCQTNITIKWEDGWLLVASFQPPLNILVFKYHQIYKILWGETSNKTQYEIPIGNFLLALAWILLLWFQAHWINKGNRCHLKTYIMYYNMSCFVDNLKFSFTSQFGVAINSLFVGSIYNFYVSRNNNKKWHQNL